MKWYFFALTILVLTSIAFFKIHENKPLVSHIVPAVNIITLTPTTTPTPSLQPFPPTKIIENNYHVFQSFNNCGPAALSMALSYFKIFKNQLELGQSLRPYQNSQGNNDDKSVTLGELAENASEYNLIAFHRPNGTVQLIKQFLAYDIPVITRTLLNEGDDIGHYRVIKGYDDRTGELIQDDSLQGNNLKYSYSQFMRLWQMFNYEYLVLVPADKEQIAIHILGKDIDVKTSWKRAVSNSQKELESNPDNIYARFNLSIAQYYVGDLSEAILEFEKVENMLPLRALWYQIEPIQAYFELGNYQRVFDLTDKIFDSQNRAFSELYIIRGEVYKKQDNLDAAKSEFEKAIFYNQNLKSAQKLLQSVE